MTNLSQFKHYIASDTIEKRINIMGVEIAHNYQSQGIGRIIAVCVLTGAIPFHADLTRAISNASQDRLDVRYDVIRAESSQGEKSSGIVKILYGPERDPQGEHVLIVDDIADTRLTTSELVKLFNNRGAASVKTAVLLNKEARKVHDVQLDYVGFPIEDHWVVGYGLDSNGAGRALRYIARKSE